jgi:Flp pilus assembly protein TadG
MRLLFSHKGQSIVEISLITPLLLAALYVPVDFGIMIFSGHLTQNAVRDGARIAATTDLLDNGLATTLATQFKPNVPQRLASRQVTVNYYANGSANCAQYVEVIAQGTYNLFWYRLIALLRAAPPTSITITRTTQMRYEHQPDTNTGNCATRTATGTF